MKHNRSLLPFYFFLFYFSTSLSAQEPNSCPCEDCPGLIEDIVGVTEYRLNVFNVKNNDLTSPDQCVSKVGLKFKHDFVGDLIIELISPAGDVVQLIGDVTFSSGQTNNRIFDISFVGNGAPPMPDNGFENRWFNSQNWQGIGTLNGSYLPNRGDLADFNEGRVNGTWTLRVTDLVSDGRIDEGELIDFYVEFCDPTGLVCDPCLDPEDTPDCVFKIDVGETTVVPDEDFCLPIYAHNVAFLETLQFPLKWDPTIIQYTGVDSFQIEFLEQSDFNIMDVGNGNLAFSYIHTFDDLGLVVADSTPIFQVCFKTLGGVGDSSLVEVSFPPLPIDINGDTLMQETIEGTVKITVDSTADCVRAIQLCSNEPISVTRSKGPGFEENEAIPDCSPDGAEQQSKWYRFDVLESGELAFQIKPNGAAIYNFSLYKGGCPSSGNGEAIDCNIGLEGTVIGISSDPMNDFGESDASGNSFLPNLNVVVGETFFLNVNNTSANGFGFDLSFAGTAIIGDKTLNVSIVDPTILNCTNPNINLDATASSQGNQYISQWTTDEGNIDFSTNFYQPLIDKGGTFFLEITDRVTGCRVIDSAFVETDMVNPLVFANNGGILDCYDPTRVLNNLGSSSGDKFAIEWTNTSTTIPDLPNTAAITVDKGGNYELKITNTENGCFATDFTLVTENFAEPELTTVDNFISCDEPVATLLATSTTSQIQFEWSGGNLDNPVPEAEISVNDTGVYIAKVTSITNGCISTDSVIVREERIYPIAEAGDLLVLNCDNPTLFLNGNGSSEGQEFEYNWATSDGQFISGTNTNSLAPEIDAGGIYALSVKNTLNGCISGDFVEVDTSFIPPAINISSDTILTCFDPILTLDATESDSGAIYEFNWFGSNGNVLQNEDTYQPSVTQSGNYIFNIRNTENGCVSTQLLEIDIDQVAPIADVGMTQTLNCSQRVIILDASLSSQGEQFNYSWTTEDGNFIDESNSITKGVDAGGIYKLSVQNSQNGCRTDTTVNVLENFVVPDLTIPNDSTLTCRIPTIALTASSLTPNTNFSWQFPDGTSMPNNQIGATVSGKYIASVTAANGCINTDSLNLEAQQVLPNIQIENPETITCVQEIINIIGEQSEQGANFEFIWTTEEGIFTDDNQPTLINPRVEKGGAYHLEITNKTTGCVAKDTIEVPSSVVNPVVSFANEPSVFSCDTTQVDILAISDVDNAVYQWKLASEIKSETALLEADAPGVYSVIVTNPANSCSSLASMQIMADTLKPLAEAGPTKELNCIIGTVELDASESVQGSEFSYLWTTLGGDEISDLTQINVDLPGLYNLIVVDQSNGCRSIDTVRVTVSRDNPVADAGIDTIYCSGVDADILDFDLGGNNTSQGANFSYQWIDERKTILGDSIKQRVNLAGIYLLEVTNTDNNCVNVDSVTVFERARPNVTFTSSGAINCVQNEISYLAESDINTTIIKWIGSTEVDSALLVVTDELLAEEFIAFAEDTITGCKGTSVTIRVEEDRMPPIITAGENAEVNCADTLRLAGQLLSADIEVAINWQTEDGNIVTSKSELTPVVDAAGQYILTIENTTNLCQAIDTVIVSTDQILPTVALGEDQILTCLNPELIITPTQLSEGANFYYNWKDENNKIITIENKLITDFPGTYQLLVVDSSNLCTKSDVITIVDSLNPPAIEILTPDLITCLNNQIELKTIINVVDATYQWSILSDTGNIIGTIDNSTLTVNEVGIYQLEVINNFSGCIGEKNISVQDIRREIAIEAGADKTITCNNDTTVLTAGTIFTPTNNLRFEWTSDVPNFSKIDSTLIFTIKESGTYFLRVIDTLSACEVIDTFVVNKDITPIDFNIGIADTLNCANENVILGDINQVGIPYFYQWSTENGNIVVGADQSAVMVNQPGVYQLDVESSINGCTFTDSLRVLLDRVEPSIDVGFPKTLTCLENEVILGGENTAIGDIYVYEWTTQNGTILTAEDSSFTTVNAAGNYQFSVRNIRNQCESTASIEVTTEQQFPGVTLPTNLFFVCTDDFISIEPEVEVSPPNFNTNWQTTDGILVSEPTDSIAAVAAPGAYFIEVEDTRNNCITRDTVLVVDNRELPEIIDLPNQVLDCKEAGIELSAAGSAAGNSIVYRWINEIGQTLSNGNLLTITDPGSYVLEITNQTNSCVSTDTFQVIENNNPPVGAAINLAGPACEGVDNGFIEIVSIVGGTAPFNYILNNFDTNSVALFSDLAPNNYALTIIDDFSCIWDTMILLNQPSPVEVSIIAEAEELVTGQTGIFTLASSIPITEIAEIIWSPSDLLNCLDCEVVNASFSNNTTLSVEIVDINGCEGSASLDINVELASIPNAITPNGDGKNDFFMVPAIEQQPEAYPNSELTIFNRWGDILYQKSPYTNDWDGRNNIGSLITEGTYYYVLRLDTREGEVLKGDITILRR